jgi:EAL and modified HD-GYP domain-containing signal transduction protein
LQSLSKLHSEGYRLALSGALSRLHPSIIGLADMLCLDMDDIPTEELGPRVDSLRSFKKRLMVAGVETPEDFQLCKSLKFDLFEGPFLSIPGAKAKDIPLVTLSTIRLLAALQDPDVRLQQLETIIQQSLPLSYKLLRFLNSAYVGLPRAVLSIRHAVGLAGIRRIQQWASLLLFSSIENKPLELYTTATIRARMCEQLCDSSDENRRATFFTVGLLSVLDAVLDVPMTEAVKLLPLSTEVYQALTNRTGPAGSTLEAVIAYERSDWGNPSLSRFPSPVLRDSYLQSLHWAVSEAAVISEQDGPNDAVSS